MVAPGQIEGQRRGKTRESSRQCVAGTSDYNLKFADLRYVLEQLGFDERVKGDHFIFTKPDVTEIINLQPIGSKAKAYQVKQVRNLVLKYKLAR
ncbi:MAG: type II toxin-antitoxin system HicA family toxin [Pseudomonadota bacterium]